MLIPSSCKLNFINGVNFLNSKFFLILRPSSRTDRLSTRSNSIVLHISVRFLFRRQFDPNLGTKILLSNQPITEGKENSMVIRRMQLGNSCSYEQLMIKAIQTDRIEEYATQIGISWMGIRSPIFISCVFCLLRNAGDNFNYGLWSPWLCEKSLVSHKL